MAISARSVIQRVVDTLQDPTSIRWPVAELVRYLNDGQREIKLHRPDSVRASGDIALKPGSRQNLPAGADKLIEIWRNNSTSSQRAVQLVDRRILDDQTPGWHKLTGVTEILHYCYDPRVPTEFFVFPPAAASGAVVLAAYSVNPTNISEADLDGKLYTSVPLTDIAVIDALANCLQDYILYRAYTKDSEYAGNGNRAQAHYASFANALGIELKGTVGAMPSTLRRNMIAGGAQSLQETVK